MYKEEIKTLLNKYFYAGAETRTSLFLTRKNVSEHLIKYCLNKGLLALKDNQGVWVYQITIKGEKFRDGMNEIL